MKTINEDPYDFFQQGGWSFLGGAGGGEEVRDAHLITSQTFSDAHPQILSAGCAYSDAAAYISYRATPTTRQSLSLSLRVLRMPRRARKAVQLAVITSMGRMRATTKAAALTSGPMIAMVRTRVLLVATITNPARR